MSAYEQLADIMSTAEGLGHLDPKHAEVMHDQIAELLASILRDVHMLTVELRVAEETVHMLEKEREAARRYLGERFFPAREVNDDGTTLMAAVEELRIEVKTALTTYPNLKIQQIKKLRNSRHAGDAWAALGNYAVDHVPQFGLKDAKDVVDHAERGYLYLGVKGSVYL